MGRIALQLARILVLLVLLRATGWYVTNRMPASGEMSDLWRPWAVVVLIGVLFVAVLLIMRWRRHPSVVLVLEALLAAPLALVLPAQWVVWFGVGAWTTAMNSGFTQPLAMAWLGVVVATGIHQRRTPARPPTSPGR